MRANNINNSQTSNSDKKIATSENSFIKEIAHTYMKEMKKVTAGPPLASLLRDI